ncbi:MAG: cell division topological specificity factor MinE [Pseudomonadota bacterium]
MKRWIDRVAQLVKPYPSAASVARERLQIIVAHQGDDSSDFIHQLQDELVAVLSKYIAIDRDKIRVQLDRTGEQSVLELNVTLDPEARPLKNARTDNRKKEKKEKQELV